MINLENFKGPEQLRQNLAAGGWIVLVARNSGSGGKNARELAADEVSKAAQGLREKTGVDITPYLPVKSVLLAGLLKSKKIKSQTSDGSTFANEYLQVVLSSINTIIFVSTGSGRKLDDQFEQPFVQELITLMKVRKPSLVFANRSDRIFRNMLTGAELLNVLKGINGFLGNSEEGILQNDSMSNIFTLVRAHGSESEAAAIPKKTRDGMKDKTDKKMVDGKLRFTVNNVPPAGTIKMALRSSNGASGMKMLYLDDPAFFPDEADVSIGFPSKEDKNKISNLVLVQWALKNIGKPGVTKNQIGDYLANNNFSSPGMRHTYGPYASFKYKENQKEKSSPVRSILFNLEFYRTGILKIRLGTVDTSDFEITDCFPPSGKWANPSDFKRIEKYMKENGGGCIATLNLVGVLVKTDDGLCRLGSTHSQDFPNDPVYSLFKLTENQSRKNFPPLPHSYLAESIVVGLTEAAKTIWIPIESQADEVNPALQNEIAKIQRGLLRLERSCATLLYQISEGDPQGNPLLDPRTRQDMALERSRILNQEIEPEKRKLESLETDLFLEMEKLSQQTEQAPANLLNELIGRLKDPTDTTYNTLWKKCLTIDSISMSRSKSRGYGTSTLKWAGTLRISALSRSFEVPFSGTYDVGGSTKIEGRVVETIALMSQGIPFDETKMKQPYTLKTFVANRLGFNRGSFVPGLITDPRILKIAMMIVTQPASSDTEIATHFEEPELLIQRVRGSIARESAGSQWIHRRSVVIGNWLYLASINEGLVQQSELLKLGGAKDWINILARVRKSAPSKDYWVSQGNQSAQMKPCSFCGSFQRSTSRLYEPVGFVCLECHLDDAGLLWPSDPYDQWLDISMK